jgi:hypothetical protein
MFSCNMLSAYYSLLMETVSVDDAFIIFLLSIIEGVSDDADDPYHYPVIRVLVWPNTQKKSMSLTEISAGPERTIPGCLHNASREWSS